MFLKPLAPFTPTVHCHISSFPSELLSAVFEALAYVPFHPLHFQQHRQSALRDIMSVSHVNSLFRDTAIHNPHLWTELPSLNITPNFMRTIVERSSPLPFCLSYVEEEGVPPISSWGLVMDHASRMKGFCVEIPEGAARDGFVARALLSLTLWRVERCIVYFRAPNNIPLFGPLELANGPAFQLKTIHLTNCHVSPQFELFLPGQLTTFGISNFGTITGASPIPLGECHKWSAQFATLQHLVLWNCFSVPLSLSIADRLRLPRLKTLAIGALFSHVAAIGDCLELPPECLRTINLFFFGSTSVDDVRVAAGAVVPFLNQDEEFQECQLDFSPRVPTLRFAHGNAKLFLRFHLFRLEAEVPPAIPFALRTSGLTAPVDVWTLTLWETVIGRLHRHLKSVWKLKLAFPSAGACGPLTLPLVLSAIPNVRSLSFDSLAAYTKHPVTMCELFFTQLEKVAIYLADGVWDSELKAIIACFLHRQVAAGNPVRELLFVVSPGLGQTLGYARADGIRLMLGELEEMIPSVVRIEWIEG